MFLALFPILLLFGGALVRADDECQNVIRVNDLMAAGDQPSQAFLHFRNVQLLTFDAKKKPACDGEGKPAIHLPGWLRLLSGEVFIRQLPPLHNESHPLLLALTLEQDSFWVGRICEKGRTQSSFLSDEFCTLPFCQLLPAACQALASAQQGQTLPLATFFPEDNWVPLEPVFHQMLEGSWKAEAELLADEELLLSEEETPQKLLGRVGVAGWHFVKAGDDEHEEL